MYELLVLIHILSAMVWVGGGFLLITALRRIRRREGQESAAHMMQELEWVDTWVFTPAPLLVVASGITMVIVSDAWAFSQTWIYLALGFVVIEFIGMDPVVRPVLRQLKTAHQDGTTSSPQYASALRRYFRLATVALSILGVIVALMVFKPGA